MEKNYQIVPTMNIRNRHNEIWIALANISIDRDKSSIPDAEYAYVTVVGRAKGRLDFRKKVAKELSQLGFTLLRLEEADKFDNRVKEFGVTDAIVALTKELKGSDEVKFSTFHTYN